MDLEFALGYLAGEGSFLFAIGKDDRYARGFSCVSRVDLTVGEKDEKVLHEIKEVFGVGSVTETSNGYAWRVSGEDDCGQIIEKIEVALQSGSGFKHSEKYEAYTRWKEGYQELYSENTDWSRMAKLAANVNPGVQRGRSEEELMELMS